MVGHSGILQPIGEQPSVNEAVPSLAVAEAFNQPVVTEHTLVPGGFILHITPLPPFEYRISAASARIAETMGLNQANDMPQKNPTYFSENSDGQHPKYRQK
jgi:hypothetical protein